MVSSDGHMVGVDKFLHAFRVFASLPKRYPWASETVDSNTTGVTAAEVDYLGKLQQKLSSGITDDELLVQCASQLKRSDARADLSRFWTTLDSAAEGQFSRECDLNDPVLPMARRWFYFRLASVIFRDGRVNPRSSSFLNLLTTNLLRISSLEKLSGAEITFLVFLCSIQRRLPIAEMKRMGDGHEIPPKLLTKIDKFAPQLTLPELGLLIGSLHMCHVKIREDAKELRHLLCKIICSVDERSAVAHENCIMNIAKFMSKGSNAGTTGGYYWNEMSRYSQQIADKYQHLVPHLSPRTVARLLILILEHVPPNYANFAEACVSSFLASSKDKYRTKDLSMLLRGLFVLNFNLRPHEKRILRAWKESWSVVNRQGRDNILCATVLARMGIFDREYVRFIIDEANASAKLRAAATESELIDGAFEMLRRHTDKGYAYNPRHRHQLEWDRSRRSGELKMSLALVAEVAALTEIFHGDDSSMPRLDLELRGKLARLFIRDSDGSHQGQRRLAVLQTMRESFGPDIVHGLSYPFGGFPDIVCCMRKTRSGIAALPLPGDFTSARLAREIVKPPPVRNGTWFAFVMTKKGHEDAAGRMLGPAVLKARILRKLGYEVIWLPFSEVQKKAWKGSHEKDGLFLSNADRREGADYLRDKILEHWESDSGSYLE